MQTSTLPGAWKHFQESDFVDIFHPRREMETRAGGETLVFLLCAFHPTQCQAHSQSITPSPIAHTVKMPEEPGDHGVFSHLLFHMEVRKIFQPFHCRHLTSGIYLRKCCPWIPEAIERKPVLNNIHPFHLQCTYKQE